MIKVIPDLQVRLRGNSVGTETVERDYLVFSKLQRYDCETVKEAREKTIAEIDDYINQLLVIRACI